MTPEAIAPLSDDPIAKRSAVTACHFRPKPEIPVCAAILLHQASARRRSGMAAKREASRSSSWSDLRFALLPIDSDASKPEKQKITPPDQTGDQSVEQPWRSRQIGG